MSPIWLQIWRFSFSLKSKQPFVYEEASGSDDSEDEYVTHVRRRAAQYYKMMF